MADIEAMLKHHLLCSDILYKELFVPAEELKGGGCTLSLITDAACMPLTSIMPLLRDLHASNHCWACV